MDNIMGKQKAVFGALIVLVVLVSICAGFLYNKNLSLESDRAQLSSEKDSVITERERCLSDLNETKSKMQMLEEDVAEIYKGCIINNACKGHYPGVRWLCNNVGDLADSSTASHICECDASCNLNATEISKG